MDMAIKEFVEFVNNMENPVVKLNQDLKRIGLKNFPTQPFHSINFHVLIKNIESHETFLDWWKSKNLTKHFHNVLIKTILNQNPPESVKHALIFMML